MFYKNRLRVLAEICLIEEVPPPYDLVEALMEAGLNPQGIHEAYHRGQSLLGRTADALLDQGVEAALQTLEGEQL